MCQNTTNVTKYVIEVLCETMTATDFYSSPAKQKYHVIHEKLLQVDR